MAIGDIRGDKEVSGPLFTEVNLNNEFVKLDQTTPQAVINGAPIMEGIQFDITPSTTNASEGLLRWNETDGTLDLGMSGGVVTQQIGQELFAKVHNPTGGATIANGSIVYISGRTGVFPDVALARSDSESTSRILGVTTQDIASPGFGFVTIMGYVRGIKTDYTGTGIWGTTWVTGDTLYLSKTTAGQLTNVEPASPHHSDIVGSVGVISTNQGSILVNIERHKTLAELNDVNGTALNTTGQMITWHNDTQVFDFDHNISEFATTTVASGKSNHHGIQSAGVKSFDNTSHVLTIASINYWFNGVNYVTASPVTCDIDSYETLTANTLYFFFFDDASGTLKCADSPWSILTGVPVAIVFWNGTAGAIGNECHGYTRDLDWHEWAHKTIGTRYESGLSLTAPTTASDNTLSIGAGTLHDEDLEISISPQTTCRIFYRVSANAFTYVDSALPYAGSGAQPQYLDTDTYTLTNVTSADFANMWVYATNDESRAIYIIPTHASTAYNTIALARAETPPALTNYPLTPEMKLIYRFIYKGDGQFQESTDYRNSSPLPSGGTASTTAGAVSFTPSGNISSATVQAAIEELDAEKQPVGTYSTDIHSNITALNAVSGTNTGDNAANSSSLPIAGGTLTGGLVLVAGTTVVQPIKMVAGTNLTTPVAGVFEFDGTSLFFSV